MGEWLLLAFVAYVVGAIFYALTGIAGPKRKQPDPRYSKRFWRDSDDDTFSSGPPPGAP